MLSPIFYVTLLFWSLHQVHVWSTINSSTVFENTPEQSAKFNYKLEQLFNDDDLNGLPHKKVIIEAQINGKMFVINNENSTEWNLINQLMNIEIHKRRDHVVFDQTRISNDSSTDIIQLRDIIAEP
ncbi:uncharacterized protein [Chelonus insularis]|uniref:uncharacterized protein isoform X2 n=1 Tax=Chelonus insularis TaxID=460826 RepID=UPI00158E0799|nr:uncharacterized protein LOC118069533 isoform X2 [Chelonus insularis]